MRKAQDRTNALRQARWRERQKLDVTVTPPAAQIVTQPKAAAPVTSLPANVRSGIVPFVVALAALAVAVVSGSFSVIGLTAIFTGAFWPIVGMGAALECAKLSAVAWLGRRYSASRALRAGVTGLVLVLMSLNAVGAYGFLSKAHIEHTVAGEAVVASHAADVAARKQVAADAVSDLDRHIAQVDAVVAEATRRGRTSAALAIIDREKGDRTKLVAERARAADALATIQVQAAGVGNEKAELAADYGPVRYLAALIGADDEKVMRWFVLVVSLLLDPAAVALLLAANTTDDRR